MNGRHTGSTDLPLLPEGEDVARRSRRSSRPHFSLVLSQSAGAGGLAHRRIARPGRRRVDPTSTSGTTATTRASPPPRSARPSGLDDLDRIRAPASEADEVASRCRRVIDRCLAADGDVAAGRPRPPAAGASPRPGSICRPRTVDSSASTPGRTACSASNTSTARSSDWNATIGGPDSAREPHPARSPGIAAGCTRSPGDRRRRRGGGVDEATCTVFVRHTSAGVCIQENADPSARRDMEAWLDRIAPEHEPWYTHVDEGPDDMPGIISRRSSPGPP